MESLEGLWTLLKENSLATSLLAAAVVGVISWMLIAKSNGSVIDPVRVSKFALKVKVEVNDNTRIFRFAIGEGKKLGLPIGKHVMLSAPAGALNEQISRKYTPISSADTVGSFDLLIKVYPAPGGLMGRYLDSMKIDDTIDVKGPFGSFDYQVGKFKTLGMLAGGTGITPMYQVITAILSNPDDPTTVSLIFANVKEKDILLRTKLETLAKEHPTRFSLYLVLNEPPTPWTGGTGFISEQHIRDNIGTPREGLQVLLCGPLPMNRAMRDNLTKIGYQKTDIFAF